MRCELCGTDPRQIYLIPRHRTDGSLVTQACEDCGIKAGFLCESHQIRIHQGFTDGTHACLDCIEEQVGQLADEMTGIIDQLRLALPRHRASSLWGDARTVADLVRCSVETVIIRFIVSYAVRTGTPVERVVFRIVTDKTADFLLPSLIA